MVIIDFVGAPLTTAALVLNLFTALGSQVNVFPFLIVATSIWPKLSRDQPPGSSVTLLEDVSSPHSNQSVAFVTAALSKCDAAVVPFVPLTQPVKSVAVFAV